MNKTRMIIIIYGGLLLNVCLLIFNFMLLTIDRNKWDPGPVYITMSPNKTIDFTFEYGLARALKKDLDSLKGRYTHKIIDSVILRLEKEEGINGYYHLLSVDSVSYEIIISSKSLDPRYNSFCLITQEGIFNFLGKQIILIQYNEMTKVFDTL